jgi:hypothetical protein
MTIPFQGAAFALSSDGLATVASNLGVFAPEIWTVLAGRDLRLRIFA